MMLWKASQPANLALIKYMGKKTGTHSNQPCNASLSYTLNGLQTTVVLEAYSGSQDRWLPLENDKLCPPPVKTTFIDLPSLPPSLEDAQHPSASFSLSKEAQSRFLSHLDRIKKIRGYSGSFIVRSNNNFPENCGLASSASSFAALTQCALEAISCQQNQPLPDKATLARLSQQGSGSSCRSFFSPWCIWDDAGARAIDLPYPNLHHVVIILSKAHKAVSSSQAHHRVLTSPYFSGRVKRAHQRLNQLIHALKKQQWSLAFSIVWEEFDDMHTLFSTAHPPFHYATPEQPKVLDYLKHFWENYGDGPLVTMDAGPNIHLLFREDQTHLMNILKYQLIQTPSKI